MARRPELLVREGPDGRLRVLDPLTDRVHDVLAEDLDAGRHPVLLEGTLAEILREQAWANRTRPPPPSFDTTDFDWGRASELPGEVLFRDPEAWRRLAEQRLSGSWLLRLPGFTEWIPPIGAEERMDTDLVHAFRVRSAAPLFEHPAVRALCGAVLGMELSGPVEANRWHMEPRDGIYAHRVGRRYAATFTLGLNEGWSASDGGAIAFGDPATGDVTERWLPHAGDALIFAGGEHSWHWVEAPRRPRHTLTGWWTF